MEIIVVGLSHKTAPVEIRERVAFAPDCFHDALRAVQDLPGVREAVIVSTCNRVEVYAASRDREDGVENLIRFMADYHGVPEPDLRPHLYVHAGADAVRHVFRVASSLDSMVVGEPQILGQVKDAYETASQGQATGLVLNRFMHADGEATYIVTMLAWQLRRLWKVKRVVAKNPRARALS